MLLQCLGAFAPFLLITFGPWLAIRVLVRPTLLRRLMIWAWRTWFTGLMVVLVLAVGGALLHPDQSVASSEKIFLSSANFSSSQKNSAVAQISASGVAPADYLQLVYSVADELGHPVEAELMMGIIQQESGWNPNALSPSGAMGLAQLMPDTASDMSVSDPYDPEQSIRGGMKYISFLLDYFNGDLETAVMAYHAGPTNMKTRGATSLDQYYAERVLGFYDDYKVKASMGQMLDVGVDTPRSDGPRMPYDGPYKMTQGLHQGPLGRDYSGGCGEPLFAPFDGYVDSVGFDGFLGRFGFNNSYIWFSDGNGTRVMYMHGRYLLDRGARVSKGQLVGYEDSIGNSTGCHTHLTVEVNGQAIDPELYFGWNGK